MKRLLGVFHEGMYAKIPAGIPDYELIRDGNPHRMHRNPDKIVQMNFEEMPKANVLYICEEI